MSPAVERVDGLAVYRRPATATTLVPSAATVVTVHGALDRGASFAKVSRRLPDRPVVRYDRRGYGRSVGHPPAADLAGSIADLVAVIGGQRSVLIGHSMGALLVLAAADRHPDLVAAVVALEPPMPWERWFVGGPGDAASLAPDGVEDAARVDDAEAAERFLRRMVGDERWARLPPSTRAARRAEGPALVADLAAARHGRPYRPTALSAPLVVGMGACTSARHRRSCRTLVASVPGATLVEVPGAEHDLHATHPDAVAAMVRLAADTNRSGPHR